MNCCFEKEKACCFIGHRKIKITEELTLKLYQEIENLITKEGVLYFLFGSKSQFDTLCYKVVTKLKLKYKDIRRIYVRAEFPYIDSDYKAFLFERYEDTYYPEKIIHAGKAVYVERNLHMLDVSKFCIMYYMDNYKPQAKLNNEFALEHKSKSGTKIAFEAALRMGSIVINVA